MNLQDLQSMDNKRIHAALISVFHKDGLDLLARKMHELGIVIYSTGGTREYLENLDIPVVAVEDITDYPSILGGRVKTLHPKIFGGILAIRNEDHLSQLAHFQIPLIDLVIVDLYPFEKTLSQTDNHDEIIEKIDIGGISLIRAAAKNFRDVVVIPSVDEYPVLTEVLENNAISSIETRKRLAAKAFSISSHYDGCINGYFEASSKTPAMVLRYGENPHQKASFSGDLPRYLEILSGKDLSYNNFLDIDSALNLMREFYDGPPTFAVLKHTNVCGLATRPKLFDAWMDALAGDPISAFGGILICNRELDLPTAEKINELFYELLIAPGFAEGVIPLLSAKKNRILIRLKKLPEQKTSRRSAVDGMLEQDLDLHHLRAEELKVVTNKAPDNDQIEDLLYAAYCAKHLKSNAITLVKNRQLIGMGCGQTSRVDACRQAIEKARTMGFDPKDSAMASEAFFPFPDCVELAAEAGVATILQPGGSVNDAKSIQRADELGLSMVLSGIRHFKH
ncbi:MAG TPA: bifunctional phosphoribosylaminoimidazolecarboxamide formyltransferase/IMP cyclohydrolase [Saprospiraceae bacterium]|nr:bifunctional phosphoribosylaminoimidazolecarboxamide formyltransferase/IMP cyclohydrolase [Saprospiraceae bacterium]